jgi:hypothetical protein
VTTSVQPGKCRRAATSPASWPNSRRATVLILTPYVLRFESASGTTGFEPSPKTHRYCDMFVPRGYAPAVADFRA